jgi:putative two-component system response regulator
MQLAHVSTVSATWADIGTLATTHGHVQKKVQQESIELTGGDFSILIADDDLAMRRSMRKQVEAWGFKVEEAESGRQALGLLAVNPKRLVLTDIDMPDGDGFDLLNEITRCYPQSGVIMVSGMTHEKIIDAAIEGGAVGYVQKPVRLPELKSQVMHAIRELQANVSQVNLDIAREYARLFVLTSDLHHIETGAHIRRIQKLSRHLALLAGCNAEHADLIGEAAGLHDIGKLAIPDAILKKPGPLTPEEFDIMKTHPVLGGQILSGARDPLLRLAHEVALHHHERWDGTGYPHALKGEECSLDARIVGLVDVYDALTERRVYKVPWPIEKVAAFFREKRGNAFQPKLVDLLLDNLSTFEQIRLAEDLGPN